MKNLIIIAASALAMTLWSCKKDPIIPSDTYEIPITEGSYWVYEWVRIDSIGQEDTLSTVETISIIGDTIINGKNYKHFQREIQPGNNIASYQFLRDSFGLIVNSAGQVVYSPTTFGVELATGTDQLLSHWKLEMFKNLSTNTPLGQFGVIDARRTYFDPSGAGITNCGSTEFVAHEYYADGIGKVKEVTGFYSDIINCTGYLEKRLVDYHIE